ncbi:cell division ATPase MinD [Candidatus Aenigmatarchaeota archaeon]
MKSIGIVSGKGGVGKTTVAINLGVALSHYFRRYVTLIDCNVTTSHIGLFLGSYHYDKTLNDVLRGNYSIEDAEIHHSSGMKIVPASLSLRDMAGIDILKLRDVIQPMIERNEIVILDGGPGLGREAIATFKASDELIFVAQPNIPSIIDIVRCQEIANEVGIKPLGIVVNMVKKDKYEMSKDEIEHLTDLPVISAIPFDNNVRKSIHNKTPLVTYKPRSGASKELFRLASTVIGEDYKESRDFGSVFRKMKFW